MTTNIPIEPPSPFHAGEVELQRGVGVADRMDSFGRRVIRDFMPDQHRDFYNQLPFIVLGTVDHEGDVWATILAGEPGFMVSPDPRRLDLAALPSASDPVATSLAAGASVGLLGIELHTRRRNRMNGIVSEIGPDGFAISVEHSFGNCPQYIQARNWHMVPGRRGAEAAVEVESFAALDEEAYEAIRRADTFFVASYVDLPDGRRQVDVSHRGGKPGFVRVDRDGMLTIPDFAGNLHFNTLGNFVLNPRAGLVFIDFTTGDMLQLTGTAEVVLQSPDIAAFQGAERLWTLRPTRMVRRRGIVPLRFDLVDWSPNSLMTGDWAEAAAKRKAEELLQQWRPFRVARIEDESTLIRSFYLEPDDGAGFNMFKAGQHLPIRVQLAGEPHKTIRTYTISSAPSDGYYRISVKREGLVSAHLHDRITVGSIIEARRPAGQFTVDTAERRPAVMVAAGVGITPILSMLRHTVYEGLRTRCVRPAYVFYAAANRKVRAFDTELLSLAERAGGAVRLTRILADPEGAVQGRDYEASGRIDMDLLRAALPFDDYDFILCGPPAFMQSIYDGLRDLNISDARIHAETFGPASLKRRIAAPHTRAGNPPADVPVPVAFSGSGKEARWKPGEGTLLELAEARGLQPDFSCRGGSCGTCATRIIKGKVAYETPPSFTPADDEALICCAVPARPDADNNRLILDL